MTSKPRHTSATLKPPPTPSPSISPIETALALTPLPELGPSIFTNTYPQWQPYGARGIFGGAVVAQSLLAAQQTVPSTMSVHSMHCYFVLAGNSSTPILYHVDHVRSGRSFATRTVKAQQQGRCIFITTCSFQKNEEEKPPGINGEKGERSVVTHQPGFPKDVPKPEECESESDSIRKLESEGKITAEAAEKALRRIDIRPFDWRRIGAFPSSPSSSLEETAPADKRVRYWVRSKTRLANGPGGFHLPALAHISDNYFIGTISRTNPAAMGGSVGMMVSLDHTIYFHCAMRTRVDEWVLIEHQGPWAGEERGMVLGRIWSEDGTLLASCVQEGLIRLKDGREGEAESKL